MISEPTSSAVRSSAWLGAVQITTPLGSHEKLGLVGAGGVHSFEAEGVTLYLGDCRDILPRLAVQAVVTDPPYGLDYKPQRSLAKCKKWQSQKPFEAVQHDDEDFEPEHLLALDVPLVMWGGNHYADKLPPSGGWLVWDKKRGGTISRGFVGSDVELAWTNIGGTAKIYNYMWSGLCRDGEVGEHHHPTQKPVSLMQWCVSMTPAGAAICDPYMGSGTTALACIRAGRKCIGIEKDPVHFATAVERIQRELSQPDFFLGGGGAELAGDANRGTKEGKAPNAEVSDGANNQKL